MSKWVTARQVMFGGPSEWNHVLQVLACRLFYGKNCPHIMGVGERWSDMAGQLVADMALSGRRENDDDE